MTPSDGKITCDVCSTNPEDMLAGSGFFKYDFLLGEDFTTAIQPQQFRNFKKSIARHIQESQSHMRNLVANRESSERARTLASKNQSIGVTLGKQAYCLLKYGRPFADYEVDMMLLSSAGVSIGNINHSRKFPSEMRKSFAEAVNFRIVTYLQTRLEATLTLPPAGIIADKVTTRRRTGQLYGAIVFTPNMPALLSSVSLGILPVKAHDGESIANDIAKYARNTALTTIRYLVLDLMGSTSILELIPN